jgi:ATP-dependent exoDNAse (exonuclease V) alpha subunit
LVKRSAGRSVTAAAAYRAAAKIADDRTGLVFDFTRRHGVVHAEIIAPSRAPAWTRDRAKLWNAVEIVEKRKDAQLARELQLALPHELTDKQRLELTRQFVRGEFVAHGMIADVAVHRPDRRGDYRNHHAHVLLTTRVISADGFGRKEREWNEVSVLEGWRTSWSDAVNRALSFHGHAVRVDHRSYADQGINREPEPKVGPIATTMERRGRPSHAGADRRAVRARNQQRAEYAETLAAISVKSDTEVTQVEQLSATRAADPGPTRTQSLPVIPISTPVAPSVQRRARTGWKRRMFSLWSRVARAVTLPAHFLAATAKRHRRNVHLSR